MRNLKKTLLLIIFPIGILTACSPDYVEQQTESSNPVNPSSQSIQLNFTSGSFIGTKNNTDFETGGTTIKTSIGDNIVYTLTYSSYSMTNRFLADISNKSSQQLSQNSDNNIQIIIGTQVYNSTSGSFTLTNEQTLQSAGMEGIELIKCKFTFTGKFNVKSITTGEQIESNVDINGIINY